MRHLCLPALLALLFSTASAQVLLVNRGDIEVAGYGQFDSGTTSMQLRLGSFAADYLQIGTNVQFFDSNFADKIAFSIFALRLFETRTYLLPYVGVSLGYGSLNITAGNDESGAEFFLFTGLKYYLSDNVTLNTELHYGIGSGETFLGDRELRSTEVGFRIGLGYLF